MHYTFKDESFFIVFMDIPPPILNNEYEIVMYRGGGDVHLSSLQRSDGFRYFEFLVKKNQEQQRKKERIVL